MLQQKKMEKYEGYGGGGGEPNNTSSMDAKSEISEGRETSPERNMDRFSAIKAESPHGPRTPEQSNGGMSISDV